MSKKRVLSHIVTLIGITFLVSAQASARPTVSKVEPPNWWAGHSVNPVRLLIRGRGFNEGKVGTAVTSKDSRLTISNIKISTRGTYLLLDLGIPADLPAGTYSLEIRTGRGKTDVPFQISRIGSHPTASSDNRISGNDIIYQVVTDRFSNGSAANDRPAGSRVAANDRTNSLSWHGGDFIGLRNNLGYLKELGVTALLLSPWYDNPDTNSGCSDQKCKMSFTGNQVTDFYSVESRFGTLADLKMLVRDAGRLGIKVIQNQIVNHVSKEHPWTKDSPFTNAFSTYQQNSLNWSVAANPNRNRQELNNLTRGWVNRDLPDLNHDNPEIIRYQIQNALWWIETTGVSGVRKDSSELVPRKFVNAWSGAILKQYPEIWLFGGINSGSPIHTAFFQGGRRGWDGVDTKFSAVSDTNVWQASKDVFTGKKPATALRMALIYDGLFDDLSGLVVPANDEDSDRFMSVPGANEDVSRLHMAFILASRGIPKLYYGEEILLTGAGNANKSDFPGGWQGDSSNKFNKADRTFKEQFMFEWVQKWIAVRKKYPAVRSGRTIDLHYDYNTYVFAREHSKADGKKEWMIFAFNRSRDPKSVSIDFKSKLGIPTTGCYEALISEKSTNELLNLGNTVSDERVCPSDFGPRRLRMERKSATAVRLTAK